MIETSQWRACIGQFAHSHHAISVRLSLYHWDGVSTDAHLPPLGVLVIAAVLLMAGDIETNPGPNGKKGKSELQDLFRSQYADLCDAVSCQHAVIPRLADVLHGAELIANDTRMAVKHTPSLSPYERASIMLDPATKLAQNSIQQAQKLCESLQKCEIQLPERILSEMKLAEFESGMNGDESELHSKYGRLRSVTSSSQPASAPLPEKVRVYQNYLKFLYRRDRFPVYYKYPEHLKVDRYIKLALVQKSKRKKDGQEDLILKLHGKIDELYEKRSRVHISMNQVGYNSVDGTLAQRILIEGSPGIGKTTFAWELCRQWQSGQMLHEYTMVVMLQCRQKEVQEAKSLYDLVIHSKKDVRKAAFEYICDNNGEGLLLLFEGYDELPADLSQSSLISRLLIGHDFPASTVMVTSRPIAHRNLPSAFLHSLHQHLEILGFTESDIEDYAASACSNVPMLLDFNNYLSLHPFILSVMFIPLQCAVITDLYMERWEAGEKAFAPSTFTGVYTDLIQTHMLRYMSGHSEYRMLVPGVSCLNDLPDEIHKNLMQLAKLAAEGIAKQQYTFAVEDLDHLGLMQRIENINTGRPSTVAYCFHHLTLQEYLAALHWSRLSPEELTTLITTSKLFPLQKMVTEGMMEKHESTVHHWPVLMFLAGLTQLKGIPTEVITDLFQFHQEYVYTKNNFSASLCQVLFEVQSPDLVSILFKDRRFSPTCTTTLDWYIIGYCIAHSSNTATWQICYDHKLGHKPEHIQMLIKGVTSFDSPSKQSGCIDYLEVIGGLELPACLKLLPALLPYARNLTVLDLRGKVPSEVCVEICSVLQNYCSKLTAFKLVTSNTAADCFKVLPTLCHLTELVDLVLGFSNSDGAQFPPQHMKKLQHFEIIASYTLALHEYLILPNRHLLQAISLKNCNMTQECTQALAAYLQSPECIISEFALYSTSFGNNFSTVTAALATSQKLSVIEISDCGTGMEDALLIATTVQENDNIESLYLLDETVTIEGAQLLLQILSPREHLVICLPDSFQYYLTSTSQDRFTLIFSDPAESIREYISGNIEEVYGSW